MRLSGTAAAVLLAVVLPAEARLGAPRRVVPPRFAPLVHHALEARSYDARNFLFTARTTTPGTQSVFVVGPDGTQRTNPTVVPAHAKSLGMTAGMYIFTIGEAFVRISERGELLDAAPIPLPVTAEAGIAGPRRFLVIGKGASFLVDANGNAEPAGAVAGNVAALAVKDEVFAVSTIVQGKFTLRMLDDEGRVLRDGAAPAEVGRVYSDGATWLLAPYSISLPHRVVDDDLNVLSTFDQRSLLLPLPGRGYLGVNERRQLFPMPDTPAEVFELRGPQYTSIQTTLPEHVFGDSSIRGNGHTLLYLDRKAFPPRAHLFSSIVQLNGALPPPLAFTGALAREAAVAATNADGVSLLVWNEPEHLASTVIYAARVSATGTLLDANPVPLTKECREARSAVATDGTDFLAVWSGCGQAGAYLVSAEGTFTPSFAVAKGRSNVSNHPAVAFDGESYIVVWPDLQRLFATPVRRDGSAILPATAHVTGSSGRIAARSGGGSLLVYTEPSLQRLVIRPLDADGHFTAETAQIVHKRARASSIIRDGDRFLLIGTDPGGSGQPFLLSLDEQGKRPDTQPGGAPIAAGARVLCDDTDCRLVWREGDAQSPGRIVAAVLRERVPDGVEVGEPVTAGTHDTIFSIGDPVLLRGPAADPDLLLYMAPDGESGSMQIFARAAASKRRATRR